MAVLIKDIDAGALSQFSDLLNEVRPVVKQSVDGEGVHLHPAGTEDAFRRGKPLPLALFCLPRPEQPVHLLVYLEPLHDLGRELEIGVVDVVILCGVIDMSLIELI